VDEVQLMLDACNLKTFAGVRNAVCLLIMFGCGLRCTELCELTMADIDWSDGVMVIRQTKTGRSRRVPFGETTAKMVRSYLLLRGKLETDRLIVNSYGEATDRYRMLKIVQFVAEKAGLDTTRVHPHLLRHSCAVNLLRNGADVFTVQKILGHSTLSMTRHYSQLADLDVIEKHRAFSPADHLQVKTGRKRIK
jgi:integrase/recombinase XerD